MAEKLTPMMQQYQGIRKGLPNNTLLFYRLGDFYEMFFEDAKQASSILNIALTKRNGIPMCGFPYHAAEGYLAKLIKAGVRVAICDQVGEAKAGKIVERVVSQIISPGTINDINLLEANRNNFLGAVYAGPKDIFGLAFVDLSTGDFRVTEVCGTSLLLDELARVSPAELIISDNQQELLGDLDGATPCDSYAFLHDHAYFALCEHFTVQSLDGFGCGDMNSAIGAAGAVLHYLTQQLRRKTDHILTLRAYRNDAYVDLGAATQEHLELVKSRGATDTSLLHALDRTVTPMGGRKLRDWILHPLIDLEEIKSRQQVVADLLDETYLLNTLRDALKSIRDVERTVGRLSQASGNARDLLALKMSLEKVPALRADLEGLVAKAGSEFSGVAEESTSPPSLAATLRAGMREFPDLVALLNTALADEPPATLKDGGIFRDGFDVALDELRAASREGKDWLASLQQKEIERTGVKSLKVKYNSVFGYFIELTKSNLGNVPDDYTRKQTMVNAERFITPELKEVEGKILGADDRARTLEYELFQDFRQRVLQFLADLQQTAASIATLDVLCSLAETARLFGYCRPQLDDSFALEVQEGRHPVLDQNIASEKFVPNDVLLDGDANRLLIITGPNMAGKSTYIRQVALLALMAQIGSFLPAASARIGIVDRIFTRVGASDDLSRGQSTFMVEMNETANIVNNASSRSLVILDEIGRGTSTFDGLSIAWSVAEHLHDSLKARTLFATHYHELTELEVTRDGVKNYNVAVREWNDEIIFLHKILRGQADKSYGIQVARLAGLPPVVIARSKEILANLERAELNAEGKPTLATTVGSPAPPKPKSKPRSRKAAAKPVTQDDTAVSEQEQEAPEPPQLSLF